MNVPAPAPMGTLGRDNPDTVSPEVGILKMKSKTVLVSLLPRLPKGPWEQVDLKIKLTEVNL